jgi:hypothetical protein
VPKSPSGWTITVFGALALFTGLLGLVAPDVLAGGLGFDTPVAGPAAVFLAASSMASFNIGAYYVLAAHRDWRPFYSATVIFRCVTVTVFTVLVVAGPAPVGFLAIAAWEASGALATGLALAFERRRASMIVA